MNRQQRRVLAHRRAQAVIAYGPSPSSDGAGLEASQTAIDSSSQEHLEMALAPVIESCPFASMVLGLPEGPTVARSF
jgi:hypothetical protein